MNGKNNRTRAGWVKLRCQNTPAQPKDEPKADSQPVPYHGDVQSIRPESENNGDKYNTSVFLLPFLNM